MVQIGSSQSFSDNHQQYTIVNEEISTESNNQSGLTEITYFDETGAEIGTSQKNFLKQNQHSKVPIQSLFIKSEQPSFVRKRQIAPANRTQQIQVLNSDGQVIQLQPTQTVLPAQTQSTSKSNQVMFAYQTILLPQQNGNQTFQGTFSPSFYHSGINFFLQFKIQTFAEFMYSRKIDVEIKYWC